METLNKVYGSAPYLNRYVATQKPLGVVALVGLGNSGTGGNDGPLLAKLRDALEARNPKSDSSGVLLQVKAYTNTDAIAPRLKSTHARGASTIDASGSARSPGPRGTSSAGGRSDGGGSGGVQGTSFASASSPTTVGTAASPLAGSMASSKKEPDVGMLRSRWLSKHQDGSTPAVVVHVEHLEALPSKDRLSVETTIASRAEKLKAVFKGRQTRVVFVVYSEVKATESPSVGGYMNWDEAMHTFRSKAGHDSKHSMLLHTADIADLSRLHQLCSENVLKYHASEAARIKKKLKADKTLRAPAPRLLTVRIRFKTAWHFEAARDPRLAAHNYTKGYEEIQRGLPRTLESVLVGDVFFYRLSLMHGVGPGAAAVAFAVREHLQWMESYDPRADVADDGPREPRTAMALLSRLIHRVHMAEAHQRYASLLSELLPYGPSGAPPGTTRLWNMPLLDAGRLKGPNAGVLQTLVGSALASRQLRSLLQAIECGGGVKLAADTVAKSDARALPGFVGREAAFSNTVSSAATLVAHIVHATSWTTASAQSYAAASAAMPVAQDFGFKRLQPHLSMLLSEHLDSTGQPTEALAHRGAAANALRDQPNIQLLLAPEVPPATATTPRPLTPHLLRFVRVSPAFVKSSLEVGQRPRLRVLLEASLPTPLRIGGVRAEAVRYGNLPPGQQHHGSSHTHQHQQRLRGASVMATTPQHSPASPGGDPAADDSGSEYPPVVFECVQDITFSDKGPLWLPAIDSDTALSAPGTYVIQRVTLLAAPALTMEEQAAVAQEDHLNASLPDDPSFAPQDLSVEVAHEHGAARVHSTTLREPQRVGAPAPGFTRIWHPPEDGLAVLRVWQPPPLLFATIRQADHAIEGERHLMELCFEASSTQPVVGTVSIAVPGWDTVEPVLLPKSGLRGRWRLNKQDPKTVAECFFRVNPGEPLVVPVVLLCRKAGVLSLPLTVTYRPVRDDEPPTRLPTAALGPDRGLYGALSLHVLHPVFAQIHVLPSLLTRAADAKGAASSACAVPTAAESSRFIESAELAAGHGPNLASTSQPLSSSSFGATLSGGGAANSLSTAQSFLRHAAVAVPILPHAPAPQLYTVQQHHVPDGKSLAIPSVDPQPLFAHTTYTNSMQCPMVVESVEYEANEASLLRLAEMPPFVETVVDVDESFATAAGFEVTEDVLPDGKKTHAPCTADPHLAADQQQRRPRTTSTVGTSTPVPLGLARLRIRRGSWGVDFHHAELATALCSAPLVYESPLPEVKFHNHGLQVTVEAPPVVQRGTPFAATLYVRNTGRTPSQVNVELQPRDTMEVCGRTRLSLSCAAGATQSVQWRITALKCGHVNLPSLALVTGTGASVSTMAKWRACYALP